MAKLLFTAVVADMRNKLNGTVFSKNRYGAYARTKVTPVNPQTTAQQVQRATLAANSQAWRGITESQRQAWISAASSFPFSDIFGNSKILSGQALFVKLNINVSNYGIGPLTDPPSPVDLPQLYNLVLTAAAGTPALSLAYAATNSRADARIVVFATPNITPGRNFVKNEFRFVTSVASNAASPLNMLAAYTAIFGAPVEAQKIFIRAFLVDENTGQAGIPYQAVDIVAP